MSILNVHEHPEATEHHKTGPHVGCECRVCVLQRRVEELEGTIRDLNSRIDDLGYELLEAGEMNEL